MSSDSQNPFSEQSSAGYRLSEGETKVIGIFVQMTQALGMPRSIGEIYGLLFATPYPLSFQDIVDRLKLSKGSVSQGLRFLRDVGAIKPVEVPSRRKEYFEPVIELRALVGGFLKERVNPQLAEWGTRANGLKIEDFGQMSGDNSDAERSAIQVSGLKPGISSSSATKVLSGRIDKLQTWQKRANTVLPMVGKLLG